MRREYTIEEVRDGLRRCLQADPHRCLGCPFHNSPCKTEMPEAALAAIKKLEADVRNGG